MEGWNADLLHQCRLVWNGIQRKDVIDEGCPVWCVCVFCISLSLSALCRGIKLPITSRRSWQATFYYRNKNVPRKIVQYLHSLCSLLLNSVLILRAAGNRALKRIPLLLCYFVLKHFGLVCIYNEHLLLQTCPILHCED